MEIIRANMHFLCFHVNFKHKAQKHACFHVNFHLVPTFTPHYIMMVKGLLQSLQHAFLKI